MTLSSPTTPSPTGYLQLIRSNPNFRNLWFGQIVSLLGDWFNFIASAALVTQLTGASGQAIGALFILRMLALFIISPFAGVWADRYDRRKLLILSDFARALTVFGFLLVRQPQHLWLLYTLTALQLGISGVFIPTQDAMIPNIVSRRELGAANALVSATWSIMLALGAALGGLAAGLWGIYPAFTIDALTFLVSAFFLYQIKSPARDIALAAESSLRASLRQYVDGLRYLKQHLDIFFISLLKAASQLTVSGAIEIIQVVIARQHFPLGEGGGISLGLIYTVIGIGTGIGPILARAITGDRDRSLRTAIFISYLFTTAGLVLIATLHNFTAVLFGTLLRAVGVGINWVFSTQLLLQLLPDRVRGRVFSTEFALLTLMSAFATFLGGWVLDNTTLGAPGLLHWMAAATLVPAALWGLWTLFGKHTPIAATTE
ncbi:MAG: MFS transporter [Anaerolineae bacterium]|nr:MFS transporter [Anaerolineae bacterium]